MFYADTSAVLAFCRSEPASDSIEQLFLAQRQPPVISDLVRVEFASALARWVRMGELGEAQANRIESAFQEDIREGRYRLVALDPGVFERAMHWLLTRRTSLRMLDALHLACAEANEAPSLTLDQALLASSEFFGLVTFSDPKPG